MKDLPLKIQEEMLGYFEKHRVSEDERKRIVKDVKEAYVRCRYDPEEAMGVVSAQSLSEPATQMTMRTYHFAGTAGIQVTLGLPRILEIFDARKEPRTPAMTVYVDSDHQSMEDIRAIAKDIKEVKAKELIVSTTLDLADMKIVCKLSMARVKDLNIDPVKLPKTIKIRNADVSVERDTMIITPKKKDISDIHKVKYSVLESHVKGIKGISQVVVTKMGDEWVISTLGSNLKKVFEIEGIDPVRTTSNDIMEIHSVLGVEAARNSIVEQAVYTMEEQGLNVDVRYVMLLADLMTFTGVIQAIGRYGISGKKASVLVRASFEETKKHFVAASTGGEDDMMLGAIENMMVNQVIPIGTGAFNLTGSIPRAKKKAKAVKKSPAKKPAKKALARKK